MHSTAIADRIGEMGLCIIEDFLRPEEAQELISDLSVSLGLGGFKAAGVGQGASRIENESIRRDKVLWLERQSANPVQRRLWLKIDELQLAFNRRLYLGLNDFEGHYTFYPEGGFYARHLDRFHKDNGRVVSFILYLNSSWQPEHGGYLRIYSSDNSYQDVPPKAGTLVCFLSAEVEHEVLPSFSPRYSFTGWFRNRRSL